MDGVAAGVARRIEVGVGAPEDVSLDLASEDRAAVVVVGAHGHGEFHDELGLGTVSHYLARHLLPPLVIVSKLGGPMRGSAVVVGVDGSPGDAATLRWAVRTADALDGSVTAV